MHLILNLISCFGPAVLEYVQRLGGKIIYKVELSLFNFGISCNYSDSLMLLLLWSDMNLIELLQHLPASHLRGSLLYLELFLQ